MGRTLGHISIIIAFGAMVGRMIDLSGGAEALAKSLVDRFGDRRIPLALTIAGFGVSIPVFFEVGVIMLMPLAYGLARTRGLSLLALSLPMCTVILVVHAMLPPHPGAVAVAGQLHVEIGRMLMFGLPLAALTSVVVFLAAKPLTRRVYPVSAEIQALLHPDAGLEETSKKDAGHDLRMPGSLPSVRLVVFLIALPIILILAGTAASLTMDPASGLRSVLAFFGIPYVALLVDVILCAILLGLRRGATMSTVSEVLGAAIPAVASIILITGAGGAFASILVATGIGPVLANSLQASGLPIVILGFLVTMLLRAAQGPTTVALMTTAGIVAPMAQAAQLSDNKMALVALAMGAGGMALSHVNDAGFWIVTRMSGLSVADGLKTWTVLTTVAGVTALALILMLWSFV
jgi:GntP family gluconate:H+ symporter